MKMKKIKLKDEYPWYSSEDYIEVSDEIAAALKQFALDEHSQVEKIRYHQAFYSLDVGDGLENQVLFVSASPQELYERKLTQAELYAAIHHLSEKQAKRIYAHFFQNMSITKIATIENVDESAIRRSLHRGLNKIEKFLKNF